MEIKRKIYQKLKDWRIKSNGSKALLVEGAKCVGKSTICTRFAKEQYKSYILIDFNKASKSLKDSFDNLENMDLFFQRLSLEYNTRLYPRESLIIFDEIQRFPKARQAIKYLVADARYDYLETGSLISIKENVEDISIPSEERKIKMYPLDFKEYMEVRNESILLEYISECFKRQQPLSQTEHTRAMHFFHEYMIVGGMPQSVVAYIENECDFYASDQEKRDILGLYRDDIKKSSKKYGMKVSALFENIPSFLSSGVKRVILKDIDTNSKYLHFAGPLFWLQDSMICNLCYRSNDPNVGFGLSRDDSSVKCYMGDTGLLVSLAFSENDISNHNLYLQIMIGKLGINKGMIYENMISQMLVSCGKSLYFYDRYDYNSHRNEIEIDFLLSNESKTKYKIFPIEVKSSKNYTRTSLLKFKKLYSSRISNSFIIHPKNLVKEKDLLRIPPYMVYCLKDQMI